MGFGLEKWRIEFFFEVVDSRNLQIAELSPWEGIVDFCRLLPDGELGQFPAFCGGGALASVCGGE